MKTRWMCIAALVMFRLSASAAITVPGADGSDGALSITSNTVIDLSQAVAGLWDDDNAANAGAGIYDSNKWAVVFKYTSVTIDAGATLTFANHPGRPPVVWLVNGDVTINGVLSLDGEDWTTAPVVAEPGPGGFRGGMGYYAASVGSSAGFGPGGGGTMVTRDGYGASHAEAVSYSPDPYGNPALVPLLGGSGGGGASNGHGGSAGGGAILIACSGTLSISGTVRSNGGNPYDQPYTANSDSGGGSGGGIRLVADIFAGSGTVEAQAGSGGSSFPGALGRVRMERVVNNNTWTAIAPSPSVVGLTAGDTALLWPITTAPTVKIVSIGGGEAPDDPLASFGTSGADVAIAQTNTTEVIIETVYVEDAAVVKVRLTPRANANYTEVTAALSQIVNADPLTIHWTADIPVNSGYSAVQVHVVRP